jgi:hypothetical protein
MPKGPKGEKRKADVIGNARPPVRLGSASKFKRAVRWPAQGGINLPHLEASG